MDFWGDLGQISAAAAGPFTLAVAIYGRKLWRATDLVAAETRLLKQQTELANEHSRLANEHSVLANEWAARRYEAEVIAAEHARRANEHAERLAEIDLNDRLRPALKLLVAPNPDSTFATLIVRHLPESNTKIIDSLTVRMGDLQNFGRPDEDGPVRGPWRIKQGTDGADLHGRHADPRAGLHRGSWTQWALAQTTKDEFPSTGLCLVEVTAVAAGRTWEYSMLVETGKAPPQPPPRKPVRQ